MMPRRHGTTSGYTGGCRCPDCRAAKNTSLRDRYRLLAYGRPTTDLVDAGPVRAHLQALMGRGARLDQVAGAAGVSYGVPTRILYTHQQRVKHSSAAAILAVRGLDTSTNRTPVDAAGCRRRVQALATLGWSLSWQARQCGTHQPQIGQIANGSTRRVAARTAARIRALYDQYWNTHPPASRSVSLVCNRARANGWVSPLAWDDDLIDLPDSELAAELARRVAAMDDAEVARCYRATRAGDTSPLIVAGAREHLARQAARRPSRTRQPAT